MHFNPNKQVFNITPNLQNPENNRTYILFQKSLILNNIIKDLKSVENDSIYLSTKPLDEISKLGKTILDASDPISLVVDLGSDCICKFAIKGMSKGAEQFFGIDGNLVSNIEAFFHDGPKDFLEDKLSNINIRLAPSKKQKDDIKDNDDLDF